VKSLGTDTKVIKKEIYKCISRAYNWLFNLAIHSGHWEEVRSTALVGLCLELREPMNSPWLARIKDWLLEQQKPIRGFCQYGDDRASWGEELWDSSIALICLNHLGLSENTPQSQKTIRWIQSLYNKNNRHNWHDEPWETSWCILAILETKAPSELPNIAYNATKWLLSIQDYDGKIVSPHYTAYFVLIGSKLIDYHLKLSQEDKKMILTAVNRATEYLLNTISEDVLWTGESWSNGQILWALSSSKNFPCNNTALLQKVVGWFVAHQDKENGSWEDVEDTASAILGLYYLLRQIAETEDRLDESDLRKKLVEHLETPKLCLKRKFIQLHDDCCTSINLSPTVRKAVAILFALASGLTVVIALWDYTKGLFGW